MMCDGADRDDVLFHHHALVEQYGWAAIAVVDDGRWERAWIYTIGLTGVDHPELVVVGVPPERCGAILEHLAGRVLDGEVLVPGDRIDALGLELELVSVHPAHIEDGLVNCALEYYDALGWPGSVDALQVVVPTTIAWCDEHAFEVPRLDDPAAWSHPVGRPSPPNRAQRRANDRNHRRRRR